jgi:hypothetical protein
VGFFSPFFILKKKRKPRWVLITQLKRRHQSLCFFAAADGVTPIPCGCHNNYDTTYGLNVGSHVIGWNTEGNCVLPDDVIYTDSARNGVPEGTPDAIMSLNLTWTEREFAGMLGPEAIAAKYIGLSGVTSTLSMVTLSNVASCAWCATGDGILRQIYNVTEVKIVFIVKSHEVHLQRLIFLGGGVLHEVLREVRWPD